MHFSFAIIFFLIVMGFKEINNKSIIDVILKLAGFTYGPLLGLFAFGIFSKRKINDKLALYVCLVAPLLIFGIDFVDNIDWYQRQLNLDAGTASGIKELSAAVFGSFRIGYEVLIYNGILTFLGLWMISKKR